MPQKVYIPHVSGEMDGEKFDSILGVYTDKEKAKEILQDDIADVKRSWTNIDFDNPQDWEEYKSDDGMSYEGFTPCDDYSYDGCVEEHEIQ